MSITALARPALALALVSATAVPACSLVSMRPPPRDAAARATAPSCNGSADTILLDGVATAVAIGVAVLAVSVSASGDSEIDTTAVSTGAGLLGIGYGVSSAYGLAVRSHCRDARRDWQAAQGQPLPPVLDAALARATLVAIQPELAACSDDVVATSAVRATVTVSGDGAVAAVAVDSELSDPRTPCLDAVLRRAHFARTERGGSFVYQARGPL